MNIGLVSNFKNCFKENSSEFVTSFTLSLLTNDSHFFISFLKNLNFTSHLFLDLLHTLFFSPDGGLSVDFTSLLVASLAELPVVDDDIFALNCTPFLVLKLLLLLSLALHALEDLVLTSLSLHVLVGLHLVDNHLSASAFTLFALSIADYFLIFGSQTSGSEGHCRTVKVGGCACNLNGCRKRILHQRLGFRVH